MGKLISLSTMRPVVIPDCVIGQIVKYTGDRANGSGIGAVIAIREQTKYSQKSYDVALADGRDFKATMLDDSRWVVSEQIAPVDHLNVLRAGVQAKEAAQVAAKSSAAAEFERIKGEIAAKNPHLVQGQSHTIAAKNIRIELKRAFPGVKFSVRSDSYSGGNAIDIGWTDGPTHDQVKKITGKYSGGHFDGMTDCYEYSRSPWTEVFGSSKYVHCHRDYSDKMVASVMGRVCRHYGGIETQPTVEDYRHGRTHSLISSGGCDMGRIIGQALQRHTYCIAKA
jgi:hypothetical protein